MPSLVVINLTNLVLNLAVCQIGPLYYENKVLPGGLMHRSLAHVFYTLEVKPWDEKNEYNDGQVASKLAQAIFTLGGLLTPWEFPKYFETIDNSNIPFWYLKHHNLPWYRKPGLRMGGDRTFIIEGGPDADEVYLRLHSNNSIADFGVHDERLKIGSIRVREIPFHPSHKHHYIDDRIKVSYGRKSSQTTTTTTTTESTSTVFVET